MLNTLSALELEDLQSLCDEGSEESLVLEFKSCNELRPGTEYKEKGVTKIRTIESIKEELSKDISAFLNATGGTIIYGVLEHKTRAHKLDNAVVALYKLIYGIMRPGNKHKRRLHDCFHMSSLRLDPIAQEWPYYERATKVPL